MRSRIPFPILGLFLILGASLSGQMLMMGEASEGFVSLFDGQSLGQWEGDPRLWKVDGGVITGSTEGTPLKANSFLIYKGDRFRDFELRLDMRLRNHNSGIQFRSEEEPGWVVKGLQADAAEGAWWGSIYDEKGKRGVIVNGWKGKGERAVKPGDWNEYSILCKGGDVRLTLNGAVTAELSGETPKDGVIALQLHAGPPMKVEFRNIRIKKLD
jgi:hypothetical protein